MHKVFQTHALQRLKLLFCLKPFMLKNIFPNEIINFGNAWFATFFNKANEELAFKFLYEITQYNWYI